MSGISQAASLSRTGARRHPHPLYPVITTPLKRNSVHRSILWSRQQRLLLSDPAEVVTGGTRHVMDSDGTLRMILLSSKRRYLFSDTSVMSGASTSEEFGSIAHFLSDNGLLAIQQQPAEYNLLVYYHIFSQTTSACCLTPYCVGPY